MREPVEREIDGITFRVKPLGFAKGRRVFLRLAKAIGPVLEKIPMKAGAPFPIMEGLAKMMDSVTAEDLEWLDEQLASDGAYSRESGKWPWMTTKEQREALFDGRFMTYGKWLAFAVEVNFADFFAAFGGQPDGAPEDSAPTKP